MLWKYSTACRSVHDIRWYIPLEIALARAGWSQSDSSQVPSMDFVVKPIHMRSLRDRGHSSILPIFLDCEHGRIILIPICSHVSSFAEASRCAGVRICCRCDRFSRKSFVRSPTCNPGWCCARTFGFCARLIRWVGWVVIVSEERRVFVDLATALHLLEWWLNQFDGLMDGQYQCWWMVVVPCVPFLVCSVLGCDCGRIFCQTQYCMREIVAESVAQLTHHSQITGNGIREE